MKGRAISQAVSCWFPGFAVNKVTLGQIFFEYFGFLGFPIQSFYRLIHTHLSSGAGTLGQIVTTRKEYSVSPHNKKKNSMV
jgi:hypothetical protein